MRKSCKTSVVTERFLSDVQNLANLKKSELYKLNIVIKEDLQKSIISKKTIF